jgi:hypothetical protein
LRNRGPLDVPKKLRAMVEFLDARRCTFVLRFSAVTFLAGNLMMNRLGELWLMASVTGGAGGRFGGHAGRQNGAHMEQGNNRQPVRPQ